MSSGDVVELSIEKLVAGGQGLARLGDGRAVFVAGVLPGERVRARVTQSRADFARANLVEVLAASAHRVEPPCPLAGPMAGGAPRQAGETCGGCDWMHIDHPFQVELKRGIVEEALRRTGRIDPLPPVSAEEPGSGFGYRNRVQLHRAPGGRLGYMAAATNRVVAADDCPIAVGPIRALLASGSPGASGEALARFTAFGDGSWLAVEGRDDDRRLSVEVAGRTVRFTVGCFFQSNLAALDRLARHVEQALPSEAGARAADLYSGVGLLAAIASTRFAEVVAVESNTVSASFVPANVPGAKLTVFPMSVEQWVQSGAAAGGFQLVIVDPPRAGLSEPVRRWLAGNRPRRLTYVSCGPVTLARDLGELARAGFAVEGIRLFDFYPQTSHIEAVALLRGAQ